MTAFELEVQDIVDRATATITHAIRTVIAHEVKLAQSERGTPSAKAARRPVAPAAASSPEEQAAAEVVLAAIGKASFMTAAQLAQALPMAMPLLKTILLRLRAERRVKTVGVTRGMRYALWP